MRATSPGNGPCLVRFLSTVLLATSTVAVSAADDKPKFDWDIWANIAVQEGGRMKPLDTLAREAVVQMTSSAKPTPGNPWNVTVGDIKSLAPLSAKSPDTAAANILALLTAETRDRLAKGQAATNWDDAPLRKQAREIRQKFKQFESDYIEANSIQPTKDQLSDYIKSPACKSQSGDEGGVLIDRLAAAESRLETHDAAVAAFVREINELMPTDELATALGVKPPANADKLQIANSNRDALAKVLPGTFKPLELTTNGSANIDLRKYEPVELYVRLLLGWQGWDKVKSVEQLQSAGPNADDAYWSFHKPDAWDASPLINARYEQMGPMLKPETKTAVSVRAIAGNEAFKAWARDLIAKSKDKEDPLAPLEEKALAVIQDYQLFMNIRLGINLVCGPNQTVKRQDWAPLFAMLTITPEQNQENFGASSSDLADFKAGFFAARAGLLANDAKQFNDGSRQFADALERLGKNSHIYPTKNEIAREINYNRSQPFLWTTAFAALSTVLLLISLGTTGRKLYYAGFGTLLIALGTMVYGTAIRIMIAGRPPVSNMYETIMWSSYVGSTLAVVLGFVYRQHKVIPLTASVVLTLSTLLAHFMPLDMGQSITPLQPVLRSNYWLIVHVMTIVGSYGAFMLAWGLGNVGLGLFLFGKTDQPTIKPLVLFCYRAIQLGVLMLAAGTILGGWWAAESWGRFWGWDPKEVWALIALIGYLIILHCRFVGWVKQFGTFAGAVLAFNGVVMAWYGVNFVLGAGLHAYAFGTGGLHYVVGAVIANLVYVGLCAAVHFGIRTKSRATAPLSKPAATTTASNAAAPEPVFSIEA